MTSRVGGTARFGVLSGLPGARRRAAAAVSPPTSPAIFSLFVRLEAISTLAHSPHTHTYTHMHTAARPSPFPAQPLPHSFALLRPHERPPALPVARRHSHIRQARFLHLPRIFSSQPKPGHFTKSGMFFNELRDATKMDKEEEDSSTPSGIPPLQAAQSLSTSSSASSSASSSITSPGGSLDPVTSALLLRPTSTAGTDVTAILTGKSPYGASGNTDIAVSKDPQQSFEGGRLRALVRGSDNLDISSPDKVDLSMLREKMDEDWAGVREADKKKYEDVPAADFKKQPISTHVTLMLSLAGNLFISGAKFYCYSRTGHSAMFSEAIHTLVDVGNQAILGWGLREAEQMPDAKHQYGYGRAAFFYSLLTALSTFGFGAMYTFYNGVSVLINPPTELAHLPETWAILGMSFVIDGFVLHTALKNTRARAQKSGVSVMQWLYSFKDPFTVAVVFEDSAAVGGVAIAALGIGLTALTGNPVFDGIATLCISGLLGAVSLKLIQLNHSFILGRPLDDNILVDIRKILKRRPSVDAMYSEQSQWVGSSTFSYKAEVDFDGTWLASQVFEKYETVFIDSVKSGGAEQLKKDLGWLLPAFAEDLTRVLEKEVRDIQQEVRNKYQEAAYVEIVPDSSQATKSALDAIMRRQFSRTAEQAQLEALLATESNPSQSHEDFFNLGNWYMAMGQVEKAALQLERCLPAREAEFGESSLQVFEVLNRLGTAYTQLGDTKKALDVLKRAQDILRLFGNAEDERMASVEENLGILYRDMGQHTKTVALFEHVLQIRDQLYGPNHTLTATAVDNLASVYSKLPVRRKNAIQYLERLLTYYDETLGANSMQAAEVYERMGKVHEILGNDEALIRVLTQSLAIKRTKLPGDDLQIATALYKLGCAYIKDKRHKEALPLLQQALEIREKHLTETDKDVEEVIQQLTDIYYKLGMQTPPHWPS